MKSLFNIKLILLFSLCALINVIISQEDKVMPGEFITWEEKIPLENPLWAARLKDFNGCRNKCGELCLGKHKGVSFCASILQRKDDPARDPVQRIVLLGSILVKNYRVTFSKNAKFHYKLKGFGEFCFNFCQR